jgi:maltokinase
VVKWAVHAEPTPASVLVPHLSEAGFAAMPAPWGFVTWQDRSDLHAVSSVLVASVMDYLPGASDGWTWAVQDVGRWATGAVDRRSALEPMDDLGTLVADLHMALATPTSVIPGPTTEAGTDESAAWRSLAEALLSEAVEVVGGPEGERLAALRPRISTTLAALDTAAGTVTMPVHGDLHIGQVLRWRDGYAVGDFDGNPVLPVPERLRPQPAARDVAGMLQSLDHVGRVVVRRVEGADPAAVEQWITDAQKCFLSAYRRRLAEADASRLLDDRLLLPFRVEQECREFLYAVRHLPRWRYVPDQALHALFREA